MVDLGNAEEVQPCSGTSVLEDGEVGILGKAIRGHM